MGGSWEAGKHGAMEAWRRGGWEAGTHGNISKFKGQSERKLELWNRIVDRYRKEFYPVYV
jgi:hypothetical protein